MTSTTRTSLAEVQEGAFKRVAAGYRNRIERGSKFEPDANRYHLYVAYACPWASRCLMVRALKGLENVISISVVHPTWQKTRPGSDNHTGWVFKNPGDPAVSNTLGYGSNPCDNALIPDTVNGCKSLREIYDLVNDKSGKYSVPVLWDKVTKSIVSNESADIIEMFNSEFNHLAKNPSMDLAPSSLKSQMKEMDDWIYPTINDGVYRCGFAQAQKDYESAFDNLFASLDRLEQMFSKSRYLFGNSVTLSDVRLFVTLVRFDQVYEVYFKCNKHFIHEYYPNIFNYTKDIYQLPGVAATVNMVHIKMHYYTSHPTLNTYGIIPKGNPIDFSAPHDRNRFTKSDA